MAIQIEVNLKIPSVTIRSTDEPVKRIDNSSVRFAKRIAVTAIPKKGDSLQVTTKFGGPFECTVTRADWNEEKALFVVSCNYANRSILPSEYDALRSDPDWSVKQLV